MMNMFQLQERIKDFSKDQLVREMQQPSGAVPPFLVLSELQRRTRMEKAFQAEQAQGQQSTVAQDAIAAAGVPQGGIADMARAMAPQTDMTGNTGAAPVQQMREGGVVRMQPGGLAGVSRDLGAYSPTMGGARGPQRPRLVVRNGIQYAEMPDGSLIPIGELGFSPEQQAGLDRPDLAAPAGFPAPSTGSLPTQADLDQRFTERKLGITGTARQLDLPSLSDIPQLPGADTTVGGSRRAFDMPTPARDMELPLVESLTGESRLDIQPPPSAESLGFVLDDFDYQNARYNAAEAARMMELNAIPFAGGEYVPPPTSMEKGEGPYTEALRSDIERQRRRLTTSDYQSRGETDSLDPRSPSYVPPFDTAGAYANLLGAPSTIETMFGDVGPLQGPAMPEFYAPSGRGAPLSARPDILMDLVPEPEVTPFGPLSVDPNLPSGYTISRLLFPGEDPEQTMRRLSELEDSYVASPTVVLDELSGLPTDMVPEGSRDVTPARARRYTPEPAPVPMSAQPDILEDMATPAAPPRAQRRTPDGGAGGAGARATGTADADKWLALAQFGLGLMASQQPTLGGAVGEAGIMALGQLRESQKEAFERDLAERTLAARSAGRGSQFPAAGANLLNSQIEALVERLADPLVTRNPALRDNLQSQLDTLLAQQRLLQGAYLSQYGLEGALDVSAPAGDLSTVRANISDE